jgi:hypothetical protein
LKTISGAKLKQGEYATMVGMDFKLLGRNSLENAVLGLIVIGYSKGGNLVLMISRQASK